MEIRYLGGVYGGNIKPTPFLCLTLKMLQIQPEKDIVVEFIKNDEFKYVRALGAFYLRLTGTSADCYKYLEPLYNDNRKLRRQNRSGQYETIYMDEFIDELLRTDRVCDIILPRVQKRHILEENNELEPKTSALDDDLEDEDTDDEDFFNEFIEKRYQSESSKKKQHKKDRDRSRSLERDCRDDRDKRYRDKDKHHKTPSDRDERDRDRYKDHDRKGDRDRDRERKDKDRYRDYKGDRDRDRDREDRKREYDTKDKRRY